MATKIYGASDDLIEFEGDIDGEISCFDFDTPVLLVLSDGTVLKVEYGKNELSIWEIRISRKGDLFKGIDKCEEETEDNYSDIIYFKDGLKWAYGATEFEKVH